FTRFLPACGRREPARTDSVPSSDGAAACTTSSTTSPPPRRPSERVAPDRLPAATGGADSTAHLGSRPAPAPPGPARVDVGAAAEALREEQEQNRGHHGGEVRAGETLRCGTPAGDP